MKNDVINLNFSDDYMSAIVVNDVENYSADGIVINLSTDTIFVEGEIDTPIQPWRSVSLREKNIRNASKIAVIKILQIENLGGVMLRGWQWFGDIFPGFPRNLPLYLSSTDSAGIVDEDPYVFTRERKIAEETQQFEIKLKCWWSPNETDCSIHNEHPFLEVHTQIHGQGRMQKFRENDASTVYEDVLMSPGFTHEAFSQVVSKDKWAYPWHRYYTDFESIWLAIELHPIN